MLGYVAEQGMGRRGQIRLSNDSCNCNEGRTHLMFYCDGDHEPHLRITDRLEMYPGCAEWFLKQQHCDRVLAAKLAEWGELPELWDHVF